MSDRDIRSRLRTSRPQEQHPKTVKTASRTKGTNGAAKSRKHIKATGSVASRNTGRGSVDTQKGTNIKQSMARALKNPAVQKTKNIWTGHRPKLITAMAVVVVVGGLLLYRVTNSNGSEGIEPQSLGLTDEGTALREAESVQQVSFNPFFPSDFEERGIEFVLQRQGDTEYAQYADRLGGVHFIVAQQQVPEEFASGGSAQIESIARALPVPAERPIQVDDTRFFISEPSAARQTVVFEKENVLVIISADEHISEMAWAGYITNLKQ